VEESGIKGDSKGTREELIKQVKKKPPRLTNQAKPPRKKPKNQGRGEKNRSPVGAKHLEKHIKKTTKPKTNSR